MKTVFNNSMVCHVFVNQSQETGRNSSSSIFFIGDKIFSYGYHYLMGKIHTAKNGKKILLINDYNYSSTTCQHKSRLRSAAIENIEYFELPEPANPKSIYNINSLEHDIFDAFNDIISAKYSRRYSLEYKLKRLKYCIYALDKYCELFGVNKKSKIDETFWQLVDEIIEFKKDHFAKIKAFRETDEYLQHVEKLIAKKNYKANFKKLVDVKNWKQNKLSYLPWNSQLKYIFIRIKDDIVQTTGRAEVPLTDAIKLLYKIDQKINADGDKIGLFKVDHVNNVKVKIGCHFIYFKEGYRTLGHLLTVYKALLEKHGQQLDICSPNYVNDFAQNMNINLTSHEVVAISNAI